MSDTPFRCKKCNVQLKNVEPWMERDLHHITWLCQDCFGSTNDNIKIPMPGYVSTAEKTNKKDTRKHIPLKNYKQKEINIGRTKW